LVCVEPVRLGKDLKEHKTTEKSNDRYPPTGAEPTVTHANGEIAKATGPR
jgi:hypothetical protein